MQQDWLQSAYCCKNQADIENWIHRFLLGPGNNQALSDGLKLIKRYWIGPLHIPLASLVRICGPEPHMEYRQDPEGWKHKISAMKHSLQTGWNPPPFILAYEKGELTLCDGNHRYEALVQLDYTHYWAFIWCNDETQYRLGLERFQPA